MDIINSEHCKRIQTDRLHAAEDKSIITFSINTEAASIFRVGNIPVTQIYGFISTEKQMWDSVVQDWLRHPDIFNLELTAIPRRHNHQKIKDFLADSRLADEGDDNAGIPGVRLRIDLCKPSGAPRAHKGGRPKKPVPASIGQPPLPPSTAASAAQTPPPPRRAAPSRSSTRTRIQYLASGPNPRANQAAADRAVALLESLAPRLCLIQRSINGGVELNAVLETANRLEHAATKALLVTTSADAPGCSVRCVVDPDLPEKFGATVRSMEGRAGWAMRVERGGDIRSPPDAAGTSTPNPTAPGGGGGGGGPTAGERAAEDPGAAADCSEESEPGVLETAGRTCHPHIIGK